MDNRNNKPIKFRRILPMTLLILIFLITLMLVVLFYKFVVDDYNNISNNNVNQMVYPPISLSQPLLKDDTSSTNQIVEKISEVKIKSGTVVPLTTRVTDEYFKDAMFIGDSTSVGFSAFGVIPPSNVLSQKNAGLDKIAKGQEIFTIKSNVKKNMQDAIKEKMNNPKKFYLLIGTNGIPGYDNDKHIKFYETVVDILKKEYPESIIYVQSLTPITKKESSKRPNFTTKKINEFNDMILEMANKKSVYYLKSEDALINEEGYLDEKYLWKNSPDGIHFTSSGHQALYNYYKTHAVLDDGMVILQDE